MSIIYLTNAEESALLNAFNFAVVFKRFPTIDIISNVESKTYKNRN